MMKNKRGDIPITILVLGVLAICILALVSFAIDSLEFQENFDIQIVKEAKLVQEKAELYKNLGMSDEQVNSVLGIKKDSEGKYALIQREGISVKSVIR